MEKRSFNRNVGENIAKNRLCAGLTQDQLAERIGISKSFLAHIEQGDRSISLYNLYMLANALNISIDSLIFGRLKNTYMQDIETTFDGLSEEDIQFLLRLIRDISEHIKDR